ncbi:hypothetical protein TruAng_011194 [Truncatella angustata]|nr:hypothetical protein TruAng_011194 [Truncatella angustata]
MTKPRNSQISVSHSRRSMRRARSSPSLQLAPTPNDEQLPQRTSTYSPSRTKAAPSADAEFFGSTAFSAIIDDDRDIINRYVEQLADQQILSNVHQRKEHTSEERIRAGMAVLNLLVDFPSFPDCIHRYLKLSYTCMVPDPFVKACVASVEETLFGPFPSSTRSRGSQLRQLVMLLFANTSTPLDLFTHVSAKVYHTLFTGPNIRWEIIGFVLATLGISLKYDVNKRNEPLSDTSPTEEPTFIHRIAEAVDYCTSVCYSYNSVSHQALWLLYGGACLKNVVYGDMNFQFWRCVGDLSSMFSALGLHQEKTKCEEIYPYYQIELRRRYAAQLYSMDKTISTILGRPPRILGSHCAIPMPADIDDAVFLLENDELDDSLRNVDANGWNLDRQFRGATWRRIKLILSQFREEVLGIYLGTQLTSENEGLVHDILTRHEFVWDTVPQELKYDELTGSQHITPPQRYVMMTTYMDQNYNRFLLYRKLANETQCMREPLYQVSRSLLATILQAISLSDQVYTMQRDMSWPILYYGLPAASILAVELLKDSIREPNTPNTQINAIPRAEVIQNLAVFVSNLRRSTNRQEVNQESCKWAHRILSSILSVIIDPKHRETVATETAQNQFMTSLPVSPNFGLNDDALNFDDFLSRMEGADWTRDISDVLI